MTRVSVPYVDYKGNDVQNVVHIFVEDVDEPIPTWVTLHTTKHVIPVF